MSFTESLAIFVTEAMEIADLFKANAVLYLLILVEGVKLTSITFK